MNAPLINLKAAPLTAVRWAPPRVAHAAGIDVDVPRSAQKPAESRRHARVATGFANALRSVLDHGHWDVFSNGFAVETRRELHFPDVTVDGVAGTGMSAARPSLIVEVLSPTSIGRDMTVKLADYLSIPSLEAYIVASQDEPIVWLWQRTEANREFATLPDEVHGREATIELGAFDVVLPLADVYRGIAAC